MEETKQNQTRINLQERTTFEEEEIKKIITHGKRKPNNWIKGYNACDGTNGVTKIAKIAGVKSPSATYVLKSWESIGIIYNIGTETRPLYMKLLTLGK